MKIEMGKKYKQRNGTPVRVLCMDSGDKDYPVLAVTPEGRPCSYTTSGEYLVGNSSGCLNLVEVSPYEDFKVDDKVMVKDVDEVWAKRFFAGVTDKGEALCFPRGRSSWTCEYNYPTTWAQCRKPTPEEIAQ